MTIENMKCPHCQKDYNNEKYPAKETMIPEKLDRADQESTDDDFLNVETFYCHFCKKYFHNIYSHRYKASWSGGSYRSFRVSVDKNVKPLVKHPYLNAKFESKSIPKHIKEYFQEAEMCRSVGSITGTAACLRKTLYAICDEHEVEGRDYKEKISNFPIRGETYKDLMREIKWLGDNGSHATTPEQEKYSIDDIDIAIGILPKLIDRIYETDEKEIEAQKLLKKAREGGFKSSKQKVPGEQ